ncbi:MAG TPA: hypothetical protein PKY51_12220 [Fimbriimonadaceae bacterium]|nr:hypothetical protein [Fimbriimonadaceae bacterium]
MKYTNWAKRVGGLVVLLAATGLATAAIKDQKTFFNVVPAVTSNPFAGTLMTHTSTVPAYSIGRIDYGGSTTQINGCTTDWVNDTILAINFNNFSAIMNGRRLAGGYFYTGAGALTASFFINPGMTVPLGSEWKFYFSNFRDDAPPGPDNQVTITFTFTDEPVTPPLGTTVNVTPGVEENQELTYFSNPLEVVWYKVVVTQPTSLTNFLDISATMPESLPVSYGLYDAAGFLLQASTAPQVPRPGFSFGGDGYVRPAYSGFYGEGQDGFLDAGTYYLAVGPTIIDFYNYFGALGRRFDELNGLLSFRTGEVTAPPAPPAPLYEQELTDPFGGFGLVPLFRGPSGGATYDRQAIDDFSVPSPGWDVTHVSASIGSSYPFLPSHSVRVWIYPKLTGGAPGAPVASIVVPGAAVTPYFQASVGQLVKRLYINLGNGVHLPPGNYYLCVQPDQNQYRETYWYSSSPTTPVAGLPAQYRAGPLSVNDIGYPLAWTETDTPVYAGPLDLAFAIYGTVSTGTGNGMTGTLDLGQLGGSPYNSGANLPTTLNISYRDASNNEIATGTATYNPVTGAVSGTIPGAVNVPFRISVKVGFWLRKTMPNPADPAAPLGNYNFGTIAPLVGDSDDDNEVTNFDYSLWAAANGNSVTANTDNDFDGDGEITNFDYSLWAANNGEMGDN